MARAPYTSRRAALRRWPATRARARLTRSSAASRWTTARATCLRHSHRTLLSALFRRRYCVAFPFRGSCAGPPGRGAQARGVSQPGTREGYGRSPSQSRRSTASSPTRGKPRAGRSTSSSPSAAVAPRAPPARARCWRCWSSAWHSWQFPPPTRTRTRFWIGPARCTQECGARYSCRPPPLLSSSAFPLSQRPALGIPWSSSTWPASARPTTPCGRREYGLSAASSSTHGSCTSCGRPSTSRGSGACTSWRPSSDFTGAATSASGRSSWRLPCWSTSSSTGWPACSSWPASSWAWSTTRGRSSRWAPATPCCCIACTCSGAGCATCARSRSSLRSSTCGMPSAGRLTTTPASS
mmetsp:Transcript_52536/g.162492  ORF Transcript_52536/g.162492 Transcript_52536/m.162492 type:complete len:353 (-) Transcript_52536:1115-2173(-)